MECSEAMQSLVSARNRRSYLDPSSTPSGMSGSAISKIVLHVNEEIHDIIGKLELRQDDMLRCIEELADLCSCLNSSKTESGDSMNGGQTEEDGECFVSKDAMNRIIDQLRQQTLLEVTIFEDLRSEQIGGDEDAITTFLSCFTHQPYVKRQELATFIGLDGF